MCIHHLHTSYSLPDWVHHLIYYCILAQDVQNKPADCCVCLWFCLWGEQIQNQLVISRICFCLTVFGDFISKAARCLEPGTHVAASTVTYDWIAFESESLLVKGWNKNHARSKFLILESVIRVHAC